MYIYIYMHVCIHVCVCVCIYIYIGEVGRLGGHRPGHLQVEGVVRLS